MMTRWGGRLHPVDLTLADDARSAARLRRMKLSATSLLAVAAGLYVLSFSLDSHGFLRAGAEAAMIGGLADWFAVTALFRRPLGLPIPHTGLVPRKKDELATKLGEFVTGHFLTAEVVVEQVRQAQVVARAGAWLADPQHADRVAREASYGVGVLLEQVEDDSAVDYVLELLRRDVSRRSYAPVLGRVLERAIEGGTQGPLVDVLVGRTRTHLVEHREALVPQAKAFIEDRHWVAWLLVTDKRVRNLLDGVAETLAEVESDQHHPLRLWLDGLLRSFAAELREDADTSGKLMALAQQLLEDPAAQAVLHDVVTDAIASLRQSLGETGPQQRISDLLAQLGTRLQTDAVFRGRVEAVLEGVVGHAVSRYGGELTELIRGQVARWDATAASQRIELAVGRDLQFIRINGTAVGALAGLTIHGLTLAAGG